MGSFSSEFLLLKGIELFAWLSVRPFFFSPLSTSAFHCVPKLNSENIHKEGQDLQATFFHFTTNKIHFSVHHRLKRRFFWKKHKCLIFWFQGILCHLASLYYMNIPVAVSQTSAYDGTMIQQCPNQILWEFRNSRLHLSTPVIWSAENTWGKCHFVSWKQQLAGNREMSAWCPGPRQDPPAPAASEDSANSMLGLLPRVAVTRWHDMQCPPIFWHRACT